MESIPPFVPVPRRTQHDISSKKNVSSETSVYDHRVTRNSLLLWNLSLHESPPSCPCAKKETVWYKQQEKWFLRNVGLRSPSYRKFPTIMEPIFSRKSPVCPCAKKETAWYKQQEKWFLRNVGLRSPGYMKFPTIMESISSWKSPHLSLCQEGNGMI
jgi:hypothetical protein